MTPQGPATAAAAGHARKVRRSAVRRAPRRLSGPTGGARTPKGRAAATKRPVLAGLMARRISGGAVALPAPRRRVHHGDRGLARRLGALVEHPWLDRLLTGRVWIAIVAVGLIGLVFMQVSLLKLNAGMGQAVERAEVLSRENAVLRADVSKLEAPDRIQQLALGAKMVLPAAGQVTFLGRDGKRMSGTEVPSVGQASSATLPVTPEQQAGQVQGAATPPTSTSTGATSASAAPAPATTATPAATQTPTTAPPAATPAAPQSTAAPVQGAGTSTGTGSTGSAGTTQATGTTGTGTSAATDTSTGGAVAGG